MTQFMPDTNQELLIDSDVDDEHYDELLKLNARNGQDGKEKKTTTQALYEKHLENINNVLTLQPMLYDEPDAEMEELEIEKTLVETKLKLQRGITEMMSMH